MGGEGASGERARLPRHVAVIMDGNGRWAEIRQLPRLAGHREGAESVRDVVRAARQIGLEAITLYAFSSQNWARPAEEVAGLMDLLRDYLITERAEIMENGIRLRAIGDIDKLPPLVREPLDALMVDSAENRAMVLTLALSYGGRESIAAAVRRVAQLVAKGELDPAALDAERFGRLLPTAELPPLDLVIRTSGELRISNFLLWEAAYAELYFSHALWPDFRRADLYAALEAYAARERRFGLTGAQIESGGDLAP
ncbi:MAG TPA: polyprenyl diphosphate synthase [Candidatus Acidoferrum sp.]|nr:polyprenyl diphosphate synthase [Candidatus Acidoferrum sp.]